MSPSRRWLVPAAALLLSGGLAVGLGPATAQQLPQPVVGRPGDLLANGSFDVGDRAGHPINWAVTGAADDAKVVNLSAYRTAGLCSLQIDTSNGSSVTVRSERIVAAAGRQYTLQAKLKGKSGTPAGLSMEFTDFNGQLLDTRAVAPTFSTDWQTVTVTGTAPANTAHVSVVIAAGQPGVSYWDQASLTAAPEPYDPVLGTARELFLDDYRVASAANVGRVVHPATKTPLPVLRADQPWRRAPTSTARSTRSAACIACGTRAPTMSHPGTSSATPRAATARPGPSRTSGRSATTTCRPTRRTWCWPVAARSPTTPARRPSSGTPR